MHLPLLIESEIVWGRLASTWTRARESWHDRIRQRFEAEHWTSLEHDARDYLEALKSFEPTLRKSQEEVARWLS